MWCVIAEILLIFGLKTENNPFFFLKKTHHLAIYESELVDRFYFACYIIIIEVRLFFSLQICYLNVYYVISENSSFSQRYQKMSRPHKWYNHSWKQHHVVAQMPTKTDEWAGERLCEQANENQNKSMKEKEKKREKGREREIDRFNQWFSKWKLMLKRWGLEIWENEKALHSGRTLLQYFNVIFFFHFRKRKSKIAGFNCNKLVTFIWSRFVSDFTLIQRET